MAGKSRYHDDGRSRVSRGRRRHDLEDSETEEELRRFLKEGADIETAEAEGTVEHNDDAAYRPYHMEPEEDFGSLGGFWVADS